MAQILLGLGSNINPRERLNNALHSLGQRLSAVETSRWFESHALRGGSNYYNLVVKAETDLSIDEIRALLYQIEDENGRERGNEATGCALDIDLLCYDAQQLETSEYQLPRADLLEHAHVLWPVAEICPEQNHPGLGISYSDLWHERKGDLLKNQTLWPI